MNWIEGIGDAISYIEENLTEELEIGEIAKRAYVSAFYFQKAFSILCGFTVSEYIRCRRLTLAGTEVFSTNEKIIDIAVKYGYDSPDSFTKAFTRFHDATPTAVRKDGAMIKSYAPIKLTFKLEGGNIMDYKIVQKEAFTVIGMSKNFSYENAKTEIPKFWSEHYQAGKGEIICGTYGINIGKEDDSNSFEYLIAGDYIPWKDVPANCKAITFPAHTWAVFPCRGTIKTMQEINGKIFSEWLPNCKDYEIADHHIIELYSDPSDFKKGVEDENYYSELWLSIKKK